MTPKYDSPPITEVVFGVYFRQLDRLLAARVGEVWDLFKSEYPECNELAPVNIPIENFSDEPPAQSVEIRDKPPLPRSWFVSADERNIIQTQRDALLFNWRQIDRDDPYPGYDAIFDQFEFVFDKFNKYVSQELRQTVEPVQYELTYINHVYKGDGWENLNDLGGVFKDFSRVKSAGRFLEFRSGINYGESYLLPDEMGRLHVSIRNGKNRASGEELLVFENRARGIISDQPLTRWFSVAHEWIVKGFADLTNDELQQSAWRRTV